MCFMHDQDALHLRYSKLPQKGQKPIQYQMTFIFAFKWNKYVCFLFQCDFQVVQKRTLSFLFSESAILRKANTTFYVVR